MISKSLRRSFGPRFQVVRTPALMSGPKGQVQALRFVHGSFFSQVVPMSGLSTI